MTPIRSDATPLPTRRRRRHRLGALACLILAIACVAGAARLARDPLPYFLARHSRLASVLAEEPRSIDGYRIERLRLVADSGLAVELAVKRPLEDAGTIGTRGTEPMERRPLIVLLGGHVTGRAALEFVDDTRGTAVAALSYPFEGNHKAKGIALLGSLPAIRAAVLDTPPAILLALDWLLAQPWVDRERVELVGVSLGAPFVCIAGALDPRVGRVWSIHGAGDPRYLLDFSLRRKIGFGPLRAACVELANRIACGSRLAPENWVGQIAPRSFVMVNARDDERLPADAVLRLYAGACEPKELVWLPGRHVEPKRKQIVQELIDRVLDRVAVGG